MQCDVEGKVALVTGSSRGIGRACAVGLAQSGADVVVNYHTHREEAEEAAAEIRAAGRRAVVVGADVSTRDGCQRLVDAAVRELGRLDIAVINAVRSVRKLTVELEPEEVESTWAVTLWHGFHTAQLAARQMLAQGQGGRIVFISSVHAFFAFPRSLAYNVGKIGYNHMAATMAAELAPARILVNTVEPGWIDTPGERQYYSEDEIREWGSRLPLGRLGRSEEIAHMVVFLCSDKADYITGAMFRVDGGFVLPRLDYEG